MAPLIVAVVHLAHVARVVDNHLHERGGVGHIAIVADVVLGIIPRIAHAQLTIAEVAPVSVEDKSKLVDLAVAVEFEHTSQLRGLATIHPVHGTIGGVDAFGWHVDTTVGFVGKSEIRLVDHVLVAIEIVVTGQGGVESGTYLQTVTEVVGIGEVCLIDGGHLRVAAIAVDGIGLLDVRIVEEVQSRCRRGILTISGEVGRGHG